MSDYNHISDFSEPLARFLCAWAEGKFERESEAEQLRVITGAIKRNPEIANDIMLVGVSSLKNYYGFALQNEERAKRWRRLKPEIKRGIIERQKKGSERQLAAFARRREKIAAFDRIVEMLDHTKVGDKILGDCTKSDLIRAAVLAEREAGELTIHAAFYRKLAEIVGPIGTVRQAQNRAGIVGLLTTTFSSDGAAA